MSESDLEGRLREKALRVTAPRLAVLAAVDKHPHADTEALARVVRSRLGSVSHQTVYDVLRILTEVGLVRRIQPAGATARYETRVSDNHHHLVCRSCRTIVDVACAVGHSPCLHAGDDNGFEVDEAEVVFWGTCPDCLTTSSASEPREGIR
jgi:Fe2+ or Zn2+ uptake regulation protein